MNRKRLTLVSLLGILAVCLVYAYWATPRLEKAPPRVTRGTQGAGGAVPLPGGEVEVSEQEVRLDALLSEPEPFPGAERDIFRFKRPAPTPRPIAAKPPAPRPTQPVVVLPPPPTAREIAEQKLSEFTFLGFLDKGGEKTVFLSSGGEVYLAKRGDRFGADQEFEVAAIENNILKVRHAAAEDLIQVPLVENQKLSPAKIRGAPSSPAGTPGRGQLRTAESFEQSDEDGTEESTIPGNNPESPGSGPDEVLEGEADGTNR